MRRALIVLGLAGALAVAGLVGISRSPSVAAGTGDTVGLVDPVTGEWHLTDEDGLVTSFLYGDPGDVPMAGDWDCDGIDTPGLFRQSDGFVYLRNSNTTGIADIRFFFGDPGDVPLAGDFDDDGCDTVSVYRPSSQRFFIINELGADEGGLGEADLDYLFGDPGDKPFVGDFDGNGVETVGLHRESTGLVYFRNSHSQGVADSQFIFGDPGDRFVGGDWNDDGADSPGLFRPSDTTFFFRFTNTQGNADDTFEFGAAGWLPVAGTFGLSGGAPPTTSSTTSTTTSTSTSTTSTSTSTTSSSTTTTTTPDMETVEVDDFFFSPASVTIEAGGTVTWDWVGSFAHSSTSGTGSGGGGMPDGNWDSNVRTGGPDFSHSATFTQPGTYTYFCKVHFGMTGTVTVTAP